MISDGPRRDWAAAFGYIGSVFFMLPGAVFAGEIILNGVEEPVAVVEVVDDIEELDIAIE